MSEDLVPAYTVRVQLPGEKKAATLEDITQKVVGFEFEDSAKLIDKATISINNQDLTCLDDERFKHDNVVEVAWGYVGNMTELRRCLVASLRGGFPVLSVEAIGHVVKMDGETKSRRFDNMTRSAVVTQIASEHGFGTDVVIEDTKVVYPSITQTRKTDAQFVRLLAHKEGFEFFVDKRGLHFRRRDMAQQPIRELMWYGGRPGDTLKSLNYEQDHKVTHGKKAKKGRDPIAKTPIKASASNAETPRTVLGTKQALVSKADLSEDTAVSKTGALSTVYTVAKDTTTGTSERTQEAAKRSADAGFHTAQQKAIKLKATLIGDPAITARRVVILQGIGRRLSGRWYIVTAKHKINASGYETDLEMERDTHNGYGDSKRDVATKGTPNKKDAKDPETLEEQTKISKTGERTVVYGVVTK